VVVILVKRIQCAEKTMSWGVETPITKIQTPNERYQFPFIPRTLRIHNRHLLVMRVQRSHNLLPEPAESIISIAWSKHTANSTVLEITLGLFVMNSHNPFLQTREHTVKNSQTGRNRLLTPQKQQQNAASEISQKIQHSSRI
jgi:hypothetical protein